MTPDNEALARKLLEQMRERLAPKPAPPEKEWPYVVVMLAVLLACVAVFALVGTCDGAPAPVVRPLPPLAKLIEGGWNLEWAGSAGHARLSRNGCWCATIAGTHYVGSWSLEGHTLTIRETALYPTPGPERTYTIALDEAQTRRRITGTIEGGSSFALIAD